MRINDISSVRCASGEFSGDNNADECDFIPKLSLGSHGIALCVGWRGILDLNSATSICEDNGFEERYHPL